VTLISLSPDDLHFIVTYDPDRERSASRRDMVAVLEEIQALINDGVIHFQEFHPRAEEAS
jgi:hypothetical protein